MLDPGLFPHRLSFDEDLVSLLPTTADKLREAAFLDGRSDISIGAPRLAAMGALLDDNLAGPAPDRFIFHVSFCGSTLLSRLLDAQGQTLILREPQCLADLAARQAMIDLTGAEDPRVNAMLDRLPRVLSRRWDGDEAIVIKPSNWINNLAPALCATRRPMLPLFLTIAPRAFLRAVFRGGGDRLAFTARAAVHFSQAGKTNAQRVARALEGDADQAIKLARLAALAVDMQARLFAAARDAGGWGSEYCFDFAELEAEPIETAIRAAYLLDLAIPPDTIAANAARWLPRDAKQPGADYSIVARRSEDSAIDDRFGAVIDEALAWAQAA